MGSGITYPSGIPRGDFEQEKGLNIKKVFETRMILKGGKTITFHSNKNPQEFFKR